MSDFLQLQQVAVRAWNISQAPTGGALAKAPRIGFAFTDTANSVQVTVYSSTTADGNIPSGSYQNSLSNTQTYVGTGGGGIPLGGSPETNRNVAVCAAVEALTQSLLATAIAAGR
jgi:hypothetical protein